MLDRSRSGPDAPPTITGLIYLNNRYHDPQLGVFVSVDPLVAKTGEPYIYGAANPITYSDPTGLDPDTAGWVRERVEANGGCTYSSGYQCFDDKYVTGNHTKIRGNQRRTARSRFDTASLGYGVAPSVVVREFSSADDALAMIDRLVGAGGALSDGASGAADAATTTVSGYQRADGTFVVACTRYKAGLADLGNGIAPAGTLRVSTRVVGRTFLVLDVGVTAFSSYRETEGHSELYRISYSAVKTGAVTGGAAGGAWLGFKGGAATGTAIGGPPGAVVGGAVGTIGGGLFGGWLGGRAADEVWEFNYERISG